MDKFRILFVDDDDLAHRNIQLVLKTAYGNNLAFEPEFYFHPQMALNAIRKNPFNVCAVFMDEQFRESGDKRLSGSSYISEIKEQNRHIQIIMVSGDRSEESLNKWVRLGVDNYLYKAEEGEEQKIAIFINDAVSRFTTKFGSLLGAGRANRFQVPEILRNISLISTSPKMEVIGELVHRVATSPLEPSVLIIGETGTGKELIAQAIHRLSPRAKEQFRVVDCTQFRGSSIIGSELFGSEKGAFTGAETKAGLFEVADRGTIFLDEVHHLDAPAQAMLLRFLQDKTIRRIGGKNERTVNVRLVFAAKPELKNMVERGDFLSDLAFRMKQMEIWVPRLAERDNDIEVLAIHFLEKVNEVTGLNQRLHPDSIEILKSYSWPGNVRELESVVRRISISVRELVILPSHIKEHAGIEISNKPVFVPGAMTIPAYRKACENGLIQLILDTYEAADFNLAEAARLLGVPRTTLRETCLSLGISQLMEFGTSDGKKDRLKLKDKFKEYTRLIFTVKSTSPKSSDNEDR